VFGRDVRHSERMPEAVPVCDASARAPERPGGSASGQVVTHVESLIFGGDVEPGATLPSETELAAALGLSRLTVREGLRALQARGLVDIGHGRRPTVAHPNATPLRDFFASSVRRDALGLLELVDVRLAIEVRAAELAATHATRSDLQSLETSLEAMRAAVDDEAAFNAADVRFHAAVASASGNRMLDFLVEGMEGPLQQSRADSIRGYRSRSEDLGVLLGYHEEIQRRIAARDARGAAASMRTHLVQTRNDLRRAFAQGPR